MAQWVKLPFGMLASPIRVPVQVLTVLLLILLMSLGRQQKLAQVFGSLSPIWETWMGLQAPGFGLVQTELLQAFVE